MDGKRIPMHGLEFTDHIYAKMSMEWKGTFRCLRSCSWA